MSPAVPIVLGEAVLDGGDRIPGAEVGEVGDHAGRVEGFALAGHDVFAALVEFGGGGIEGEGHVLAGAVAGGFAGLGDEAECLAGHATNVGDEGVVADIGGMAGGVEGFFQGLEDFGTHADALGHGGGGDGLYHELLDVDGIVGVLAAIDDVHHRHGQGTGVDAADVAVEREADILGRRLGHREGDAEDGVGAEAGLVGGAVQVDHHVVDLDLVGGVQPGQHVEDLALHVGRSLADALAAEAGFVAVAQLHRLVRAGGGAGGHRDPAHGAAVEHHLHLERRVAAAVEDLAGDDVGDVGHGESCSVVLLRRG